MARRRRRQPVPLYTVGLKHGTDFEHYGIVSALHDILDCYTNEDTQVVLTDTWTGESRRIRGTDRTPPPVLIHG